MPAALPLRADTGDAQIFWEEATASLGVFSSRIVALMLEVLSEAVGWPSAGDGE